MDFSNVSDLITSGLLKNETVCGCLNCGTVGGFGFTKLLDPIPNNEDSISVGLKEKLSAGI